VSGQKQVPDGPVLAGLIGSAPMEATLRRAFLEADERHAGLSVILTGAAEPDDDRQMYELVDRWSEKFPDVPVRSGIRRGIDAAVTLAAASRGCALLVTQEPRDGTGEALAKALSRRACCPVVVAHTAAPALL
jgi:hypothetical protein